jgi:RNA polymerase primary sigma factor
MEIIEPGPQGAVDSAEEVDQESSEAPDRGRIDDPVRLYLTQMAQIPLLPREDELLLAVRIDIERRRYRAKVLESPVAIAEAIRLLEGVKNGNRAFDRTLQRDLSSEAQKREILERLPDVVFRLKRLMDDTGECFERLREPGWSPDERRRAQARIRENRRLGVRLLEATKLQTRRIKSMMDNGSRSTQNYSH